MKILSLLLLLFIIFACSQNENPNSQTEIIEVKKIPLTIPVRRTNSTFEKQYKLVQHSKTKNQEYSFYYTLKCDTSSAPFIINLNKRTDTLYHIALNSYYGESPELLSLECIPDSLKLFYSYGTNIKCDFTYYLYVENDSLYHYKTCFGYLSNNDYNMMYLEETSKTEISKLNFRVRSNQIYENYAPQ
jgi:hypothetical protein